MGITPFDVSLRTFTVYEHVYEFDEDRMSIDEKEVVYDAAANAMGRKSDIVTFAAAYAAVTTFTTNCDFSAGAFSAPAAMTMCMALQGQKVPWDGNVFCLLPQQAWNEFLLNKVVNSADHVNRDDLPFTKATDSRFWNGVNWLLYVEETAEDMYLSTGFGGAGKQDTLMWHESALGWAPHTDLQVKTQWHNEIDALSINMKMKGAPTTLQPATASSAPGSAPPAPWRWSSRQQHTATCRRDDPRPRLRNPRHAARCRTRRTLQWLATA
jgi:hypothetical protein